MKEPTFSICIPNYNYGHLIGETIESVLQQTYPHYEIIIVDNASTDNSVGVIQSFKSDKIRFYRNRYNIGFAPNLQKVTSYAKNQFINLLSSDDLMRPTALEDYAGVIMDLDEQSRGRGLVLFAETESVDARGNVLGVSKKAIDSFQKVWVDSNGSANLSSDGKVDFSHYDGHEVLRDGFQRLGTVGSFCSTVYSRSLWNAIEGYNCLRRLNPDKQFIYKVLFLNPVVSYVHKPLFAYRAEVSDNRKTSRRTVALAIDDYYFTLDYADKQLKTLGLSHKELVKVFLDQRCLKDALAEIGLGNYHLALKLFAFCFATYPAQALKLGKTYGLLALLLTGPFARWVAPPLRNVYRRFMKKPQPVQMREEWQLA